MRIEVTPNEGIGLFAVVAVAAYASPLLDPSRQWEFLYVWDDRENFFETTAFLGLSSQHLWEMATLRKINVYEPLGWLLKALVYRVAGLDAWVFRVVTLCLHLTSAWILARASALVLWLAGFQTAGGTGTRLPRPTSPSTFLHGCYLSALLYAVHPIHVEVVSWPSAQPYALAAVFSALSVWCYCRVVVQQLSVRCEANRADPAHACNSEHSLIVCPLTLPQAVSVCSPKLLNSNAIASSVFYFCAVLSKSVSVLLPVAMILIDLLILIPSFVNPQAPTRSLYECVRLLRQYARSKLLLIGTALIFIVTTIHFNEEGMRDDADSISLDVQERLLKAAIAPMWILRNVFWPVNLRPHYQLKEDELQLLENPECLLSVLIHLMLVAWLVCFVKSPRQNLSRLALGLAVVYYAVMLLPTSGLIQHGMVPKAANRYAYFPTMVLIPLGGSWLTEWLPSQEEVPSAHAECVPERSPPKDDEQDVLAGGSIGARCKSGSPRASSITVGAQKVVLAMVTAAMIMISSQQFEIWRDSGRLTQYSILVDSTDWRMLDLRTTYFLNYGGGCGPNLDRCRNLMQLAYFFAPTKTVKAQLMRLKLLTLLGGAQEACQRYRALLDAHPQSCELLNNVGICVMTTDVKEVAAARELFERAATAPRCDDRRSAPEENLQRLNEWALRSSSMEATDGPLGFEGRLMW